MSEPAFPYDEQRVGSMGQEYTQQWPGMTLRDYFAGQAVVGLLASSNQLWKSDELAQKSYLVADKMLLMREKNDQTSS